MGLELELGFGVVLVFAFPFAPRPAASHNGPPNKGMRATPRAFQEDVSGGRFEEG